MVLHAVDPLITGIVPIAQFHKKSSKTLCDAPDVKPCSRRAPRGWCEEVSEWWRLWGSSPFSASWAAEWAWTSPEPG